MVQVPQIGRKLTHKRQERRLISRAVQQIISPKAELSPNVTSAPPTLVQAPPGDLATLIQEFRDEAARMTPEEIAAEDAAFANVEFTRLSLPVPDVSNYD